MLTASGGPFRGRTDLSGVTPGEALAHPTWEMGGRITIDGVDVRDLRLDRLRQLVATAFEDPTLFSMSARENIALGRPDGVDREQLIRLTVAMVLAGLTEVADPA